VSDNTVAQNIASVLSLFSLALCLFCGTLLTYDGARIVVNVSVCCEEGKVNMSLYLVCKPYQRELMLQAIDCLPDDIPTLY
jgi:hypothetical protein